VGSGEIQNLQAACKDDETAGGKARSATNAPEEDSARSKGAPARRQPQKAGPAPRSGAQNLAAGTPPANGSRSGGPAEVDGRASREARARASCAF